MTMITVPGIWIPNQWSGPTASAPSLTSQAMGAADKYAMVFQAPKSGSIRKIAFATGAVTTAQDTDARLETVSLTDGNPTTTLFGTNTNATVAAASITANAWVTSPAFTADATVTVGDLMAAVLVPTSTPNYNITGFTVGSSLLRYPYIDFTLDGVTWTKQSAFLPSMAVEYSDGSYYYLANVAPFYVINTHSTFNTGSSPDEIGMKFQLDVPSRLTGLWLWADTDGDFSIEVYDSDGSTVLSSTAFDKDVRQGTSPGMHFLMLDTAVSITKDTNYRITVKPTSATNLIIYSGDVGAAAVMDTLGGGQNMIQTTRTDAGAWTDTTTRRPLMGLLFDQMDDGAGGGGGTNVFIHTE